MRLARLLFPAIRWDARIGFDGERDAIERALRMGVGGFSLFGGRAGAVAELTAELRSVSDFPLLIASDLERGAGQQFEGATQLPALAAIGALDDLDATRAAAALTAREALSLGINWVYAPVADVDLEARNPIVGTRAFGTDPTAVARQVAAWIEGCRGAGALACAKHFPGHGRTVDDSHAGLPLVDADAGALEADLTPFRAAIAAGVEAIMTAHVAYPALDPSGAPATLSAPILRRLREKLGFKGLIVTDALIMQGVLDAGAGEAGAAVRAVAAGCDALLYPRDFDGILEALDRALDRTLSHERVDDALRRIDALARAAPKSGAGSWGDPADREGALVLALRCIVPVRGQGVCPRRFDLLVVDDDVGGPFAPPSRDAFPAALRSHGVDAREVTVADTERELVIALYSDIRGWKGRPGLSEDATRTVAEAVERQPHAIVVLFGHPRLAADIAGETVVSAWGGERIMQEAAAAWLAGAASP